MNNIIFDNQNDKTCRIYSVIDGWGLLLYQNANSITELLAIYITTMNEITRLYGVANYGIIKLNLNLIVYNIKSFL